MPPLWRNIPERYKNKCAILQSGMRKNQIIWRAGLLHHLGQTVPMTIGFGIRQNRVATGDQIKVKRPHTPTFYSFSPELCFDSMKDRENVAGLYVALEMGGGVYVVRSCAGWKTGGLIKGADRHDLYVFLTNCFNRRFECLTRRTFA